jgi:hypothetical protein
MSNYHIAELNVAQLRAPLDSPELKDFVDNLDRINALAESSEGFAWRLKDEANDATSIRPLGADVIINLSTWRDVASLKRFVYQTAHAPIMRRRREWFTRMADAYMVMWWVPAGHQPTAAEAVAKLEHLRQHGPSPEAFTFGDAFAAPDATQPGARFSFKDACPA